MSLKISSSGRFVRTAPQPSLLSDTVDRSRLLVPITYIQPDFDELQKRFTRVNPVYRGQKFRPISIFRDAKFQDGEATCNGLHLDRSASTNGVILEMGRRKLRPTLYEGLLCFAAQTCPELKKHSLVALGSETLLDGARYVACLLGGENLCLALIDTIWPRSFWFLAEECA